ncbi:hypothetical protein CDL15_Pgr017650 [Punica granatum]|uniref:Uncharacterized protein n=1 Tax=Punica granatum TaxID=22663 RepID=A0A218XPB2_PUNGR|nr:hypothetical protein CDL15_Pgr017650 [Punica granatum]
MGGGEDSGGCGRRFQLLGAAATAREDAGNDSEHYLGYAMLEMGVTGIGTVWTVLDFSARDFPV